MAVDAVFGGELRWVSDNDKWVSQTLDTRLSGVPNLGDFRLVEPPRSVDVLSAGFPCQDISVAGRQVGLDGHRSGLWFDVLDYVNLLRPQYVVIENVANLKNKGLDVVTSGLSEAGYGGAWCFWRAGYYSKNPSKFPHVEACHQRKRLFLIAKRGLHNFVEIQASYGQSSDYEVAELLPTPTASRSGSNVGGGSGRVGKVRYSLDSIDKLLPTPRTTDSNGPGLHGNGGMDLRTAVSSLLPTPTDRDHKDGASIGTVPENGLLGSTVWRLEDTWAEYGPAVQRWSEIKGDPPKPFNDGSKLNPQLSEWMMGYPKGWVTDLPLSRTQQLKMIGNAVMPQQGAAALGHLRHVVDA